MKRSILVVGLVLMFGAVAMASPVPYPVLDLPSPDLVLSPNLPPIGNKWLTDALTGSVILLCWLLGTWWNKAEETI